MSAAPGESDRGQRLPQARRIRHGLEIRALFQRGKRRRTAHLDVYDSPSPAGHPRVGVVVPRYRRPVVERNRLKRRIREILRRSVMPGLEQAGLSLDVLVRARPEAYDAAFHDLKVELEQWTDHRCSQGPRSS